MARLREGEELELRILYAIHEFRCEDCGERIEWTVNGEEGDYSGYCACEGRLWDLTPTKGVVSFQEDPEEEE